MVKRILSCSVSNFTIRIPFYSHMSSQTPHIIYFLLISSASEVSVGMLSSITLFHITDPWHSWHYSPECEYCEYLLTVRQTCAHHAHFIIIFFSFGLNLIKVYVTQLTRLVSNFQGLRQVNIYLPSNEYDCI